MKIIQILLILMILTIPTALAYKGGTTNTVGHFENCVNMTVEVTSNNTISPTEYILNNCIEIINNEWFCECNGSYDLNITTQINTINSYNIKTNYIISIDDIPEVDMTKIIVNNDDIVTYQVTYINDKLAFNFSSHGQKTVNISIGDLGCPYELTVSGLSTVFTCIDKHVIFDAHFSNKIIILNYNAPSTTKKSSGHYFNWVKPDTIINDTVISTPVISTPVISNEPESNLILNEDNEIIYTDSLDYLLDETDEADEINNGLYPFLIVIVFCVCIFLIIKRIKRNDKTEE